MLKTIDTHAAGEKSFMEMRYEYISMATHEFKTPITAISSSIELLETKMQLDELMLPFYKRNLSRIKEEITILSNMVDDILITGSMVAGNPVTRAELTNATAFARMIKQQYFHQRPDKRLLRIKISGTRRDIYTDKSQLTGILTNLVSNAFKYSQGQDPTLSLHYRQKELCIKVKDNGIGIPEKDIRFLFTPYFRAGNVGNREGAGLGLAIVKCFVNANNGTITVSSDTTGTVFTLTFPYAPTDNRE
ncbi:sensor histidine kinase [Chitinophaga sp. 22321]|uniref:histidine kinase n=1 Tax=Chitinophaga hostae TaxID=2831022 RepID=A0ABS5IVN8_9BACT|nr:HAMP domain-containing sensor histidine kinase [Chitinophaga hostae]MBS0027020.1 HAMP domain-containing histidine kinase [Chitinophaga hostae]